MSHLIRSIDAELGVTMGSPERVEALCARLVEAGRQAPHGDYLHAILPLARRLRERDGTIGKPVFDLLRRAAASCEAPWPLLDELLHAREPGFVREALGVALQRARSGSLAIDEGVLGSLAGLVDGEGGPWKEPDLLATIGDLLSSPSPGRSLPQERLDALYLTPGPMGIRRLAARLLDLPGEPAPPLIAARLLGEEAHALLAPFLAYTRAGHQDLLSLVHDASRAGLPLRVLESLRRAVAVCGDDLIRDVIAQVGWPRVCAGIEASRFAGVSLGGSIPYMVRPEEAPLLESLAGARRAGESILVLAHGGVPAAVIEPAGGGAAARFRALNLSHATLLEQIMDVAPLDRAKLERLVAGMDRVVEEFGALFAAQAEECAILPGLYRELKERILAGVARQAAAPQLSADLTRLVLAFEDPRTLGEVRSLHGLKRYLHQRGLRLGFNLVESAGATNRTVDLLLCGPGGVLHRGPRIEYVDFEPGLETAARRSSDGALLPDPVSLLVEAFGRQLLHGHRSFPSVRVFCYGNEVHYFLGFRAHPAFLRVDYAPPLLGGMVDLEFYGVSKYEMGQHPNVRLDALCAFLRRLEFDCSVEATRVSARFDKERALDLGDLRAKAEALFRLVPYLMDLDWIVGGLSLEEEARREVASAWAQRFCLWGTLPVSQVLTEDRQGILAAVEEGPAGPAEVRWTGAGPYRDRIAASPVASDFAPLFRRLRLSGLGLPSGIEDGTTAVGQLVLERDLLRPLRSAIARGQILLGLEGPEARTPDLFDAVPEARRFAEILSDGGEDLVAASLLARLIGPLERGLRFHTTGSVNEHEVQRAPLLLRGDPHTLYVLRDGAGIARLALCGPGDLIWRRRESPGSPWIPSPSLTASWLSPLLRAEGYLVAGVGPPAEESEGIVEEVRARFRRAGPFKPRAPASGERRAAGLGAAPGRAAGPARFGTEGRRPQDLDGSVLVTPTVRPQDSVFLYHCEGVVSTGGGALSHAGLIATQFRKPALIVSGEWRSSPDGTLALAYKTIEYRERGEEVDGFRVSVRHDILEREHVMRDGDLVVVDADSGSLRVLGQGRDALALHDGLRALSDLEGRLQQASDAAALLAARGRRLRARFLVEKILTRLADPVLACHALEELLLAPPLRTIGGRARDRSALLALLVDSPHVGAVAREALQEAIATLRRRARGAIDRASRRIPTSTSTDEILTLVEEVRRRQDDLRGALEILPEGGRQASSPDVMAVSEARLAARRRLAILREELARCVEAGSRGASPPARWRHALRDLERMEEALGEPRSPVAAEARSRLERRDERAMRSLEEREVLESGACGLETHPLIGWKAANLAEVDRLAGSSLVPAWFAVTDRAFQRVLDLPVGGPARSATEEPPVALTLRDAIEAVIATPGLDDARRSARIRGLWERIRIPAGLATAIAEAYRRLDAASTPHPDGPGARTESERGSGPCFVAVRSSALEEDTELVARAGEFETFLFVRGEESVIEHVRRAWCSLWTERAIHHRALLGPAAARAGGGVIVQRMARSRASGVLQTINTAAGDFREIVVNAGLGLGEGVVSGVVAADHIVVAKASAGGPLRFRYTTADKREQVVYNARAGTGTTMIESRYHERLRPALEYVELAELVKIGAGLEAEYGHPLDIEFGVEGARLWILQVRPVPAALSVPHALEEARA